MEPWIIWLIAAVLLLIIEVLSTMVWTLCLDMKYIDTLKEMTSGTDNKTVYIPYEASSVLSSLGSIKSIFNNSNA